MTVLFLVVYLPDLGHGFLKDDFRWIWTARSNDWRDLLDLFQQNVGFYRPVVSVSFAADHAMWGLNPYGYGLTNLLLCLVDALLIFALARRLELPSGAAMIAAFVWLFNFHGVSMALLWLSGRTALLLILFALATAHAMLRGRAVAAGVLSLFAMLSKEEAVAIPLMWMAIAWIETTTTAPRPDMLTRVRRAAAHTWPLWMALALYGALRLNSGAFGALDAPSVPTSFRCRPFWWRETSCGMRTGRERSRSPSSSCSGSWQGDSAISAQAKGERSTYRCSGF